MPAHFIGCASANFRAGRPAGFTADAIVLHRSGRSRDALRTLFNDATTSLSTHYVVARTGDIDQYVLEVDTAFHAGIVVGATWPLIRPTVNPNFHTIGIELEGAHEDDWPDAQVVATAALIAAVAGRWSIPIDADHVVTHSAIRASSRCPAPTCPVAPIVAAAQAHTSSLRVPQQLVVRTIARTNLRHGAPSLRAPIVRTMPADTDVAVAGFTDAGDRVNGNACWYADEDGRYFWAGGTNVPQPTDDAVLGGDSDTPGKSTDEMELPPPPAPDRDDTPATAPPIDRSTFALPAKEFFAQQTPKNLIVLHFTAGTTARSAFETWRRDPQHIATSYIVDVDGTIYEVFPPVFWAAHLGLKGTNHVHDRRSIGIEIANAGPLQPSADDASVLNWWPPKSKTAPQFTTKFCRRDETDRYVDADFRGMRHFAAYPAVQVDAVAALVRHLCDQFSIAPTLPAIPRRFECDATGFASYKGVCSHANFRQDKWDIGPAFPWERLGL